MYTLKSYECFRTCARPKGWGGGDTRCFCICVWLLHWTHSCSCSCSSLLLPAPYPPLPPCILFAENRVLYSTSEHGSLANAGPPKVEAPPLQELAVLETKGDADGEGGGAGLSEADAAALEAKAREDAKAEEMYRALEARFREELGLAADAEGEGGGAGGPAV